MLKPIGFGWRLSARQRASRKATSLPPRSTNWSRANCALSVMSFGWSTSSTLIFSSIDSTSMPTGCTSKSRFSSLMKTQGSLPCWRPICIIIGFDGWPKIGSGDITPTTGLVVVRICERARARSYSSSFSRWGERKGKVAFWGGYSMATPR